MTDRSIGDRIRAAVVAARDLAKDEIAKEKKTGEKSKAIERVSKVTSKKGYDTTGIKLPYLWEIMISEFDAENLRVIPSQIDTRIMDRGQYTPFSISMRVTVAVLSDGEIVAETSAWGGHEARMLGDALKGAETNGTKKALSLWGIGIDAYKGTLDEDAVLQDSTDTGGARAVQPKTRVSTDHLGQFQDVRDEFVRVADGIQRNLDINCYETYLVGKKGKAVARHDLVKWIFSGARYGWLKSQLEKMKSDHGEPGEDITDKDIPF